MSTTKTDLTYVGDGRFLVGVPATDLDADQLADLGLDADELVASGLYEKGKPKAEKAEQGKRAKE